MLKDLLKHLGFGLCVTFLTVTVLTPFGASRGPLSMVYAQGQGDDEPSKGVDLTDPKFNAPQILKDAWSKTLDAVSASSQERNEGDAFCKSKLFGTISKETCYATCPKPDRSCRIVQTHRAEYYDDLDEDLNCYGCSAALTCADFGLMNWFPGCVLNCNPNPKKQCVAGTTFPPVAGFGGAFIPFPTDASGAQCYDCVNKPDKCPDVWPGTSYDATCGGPMACNPNTHNCVNVGMHPQGYTCHKCVKKPPPPPKTCHDWGFIYQAECKNCPANRPKCEQAKGMGILWPAGPIQDEVGNACFHCVPADWKPPPDPPPPPPEKLTCSDYKWKGNRIQDEPCECAPDERKHSWDLSDGQGGTISCCTCEPNACTPDLMEWQCAQCEADGKHQCVPITRERGKPPCYRCIEKKEEKPPPESCADLELPESCRDMECEINEKCEMTEITFGPRDENGNLRKLNCPQCIPQDDLRGSCQEYGGWPSCAHCLSQGLRCITPAQKVRDDPELYCYKCKDVSCPDEAIGAMPGDCASNPGICPADKPHCVDAEGGCHICREKPGCGEDPYLYSDPNCNGDCEPQGQECVSDIWLEGYEHCYYCEDIERCEDEQNSYSSPDCGGACEKEGLVCRPDVFMNNFSDLTCYTCVEPCEPQEGQFKESSCNNTCEDGQDCRPIPGNDFGCYGCFEHLTNCEEEKLKNKAACEAECKDDDTRACTPTAVAPNGEQCYNCLSKPDYLCKAEQGEFPAGANCNDTCSEDQECRPIPGHDYGCESCVDKPDRPCDEAGQYTDSSCGGACPTHQKCAPDPDEQGCFACVNKRCSDFGEGLGNIKECEASCDGECVGERTVSGAYCYRCVMSEPCSGDGQYTDSSCGGACPVHQKCAPDPDEQGCFACVNKRCSDFGEGLGNIKECEASCDGECVGERTVSGAYCYRCHERSDCEQRELSEGGCPGECSFEYKCEETTVGQSKCHECVEKRCEDFGYVDNVYDCDCDPKYCVQIPYVDLPTYMGQCFTCNVPECSDGYKPGSCPRDCSEGERCEDDPSGAGCHRCTTSIMEEMDKCAPRELLTGACPGLCDDDEECHDRMVEGQACHECAPKNECADIPCSKCSQCEQDPLRFCSSAHTQANGEDCCVCRLKPVEEVCGEGYQLGGCPGECVLNEEACIPHQEYDCHTCKPKYCADIPCSQCEACEQDPTRYCVSAFTESADGPCCLCRQRPVTEVCGDGYRYGSCPGECELNNKVCQSHPELADTCYRCVDKEEQEKDQCEHAELLPGGCPASCSQGEVCIQTNLKQGVACHQCVEEEECSDYNAYDSSDCDGQCQAGERCDVQLPFPPPYPEKGCYECIKTEEAKQCEERELLPGGCPASCSEGEVCIETNLGKGNKCHECEQEKSCADYGAFVSSDCDGQCKRGQRCEVQLPFPPPYPEEGCYECVGEPEEEDKCEQAELLKGGCPGKCDEDEKCEARAIDGQSCHECVPKTCADFGYYETYVDCPCEPEFCHKVAYVDLPPGFGECYYCTEDTRSECEKSELKEGGCPGECSFEYKCEETTVGQSKCHECVEKRCEDFGYVDNVYDCDCDPKYCVQIPYVDLPTYMGQCFTCNVPECSDGYKPGSCPRDCSEGERCEDDPSGAGCHRCTTSIMEEMDKCAPRELLTGACPGLCDDDEECHDRMVEGQACHECASKSYDCGQDDMYNDADCDGQCPQDLCEMRIISKPGEGGMCYYCKEPAETEDKCAQRELISGGCPGSCYDRQRCTETTVDGQLCHNCERIETNDQCDKGFAPGKCLPITCSESMSCVEVAGPCHKCIQKEMSCHDYGYGTGNCSRNRCSIDEDCVDLNIGGMECYECRKDVCAQYGDYAGPCPGRCKEGALCKARHHNDQICHYCVSEDIQCPNGYVGGECKEGTCEFPKVCDVHPEKFWCYRCKAPSMSKCYYQQKQDGPCTSSSCPSDDAECVEFDVDGDKCHWCQVKPQEESDACEKAELFSGSCPGSCSADETCFPRTVDGQDCHYCDEKPAKDDLCLDEDAYADPNCNGACSSNEECRSIGTKISLHYGALTCYDCFEKGSEQTLCDPPYKPGLCDDSCPPGDCYSYALADRQMLCSYCRPSTYACQPPTFNLSGCQDCVAQGGKCVPAGAPSGGGFGGLGGGPNGGGGFNDFGVNPEHYGICAMVMEQGLGLCYRCEYPESCEKYGEYSTCMECYPDEICLPGHVVPNPLNRFSSIQCVRCVPKSQIEYIEYIIIIIETPHGRYVLDRDEEGMDRFVPSSVMALAKVDPQGRIANAAGELKKITDLVGGFNSGIGPTGLASSSKISMESLVNQLKGGLEGNTRYGQNCFDDFADEDADGGRSRKGDEQAQPSDQELREMDEQGDPAVTGPVVACGNVGKEKALGIYDASGALIKTITQDMLKDRPELVTEVINNAQQATDRFLNIKKPDIAGLFEKFTGLPVKQAQQVISQIPKKENGKKKKEDDPDVEIVPNDPFYYYEEENKKKLFGLFGSSKSNPGISIGSNLKMGGKVLGMGSGGRDKGPEIKDQYGLHQIGFMPMHEPDSAWNVVDASLRNITVAVIDSGFDFDHPDAPQYIWVNEDEIPDNGFDDDNNGLIDDVHGWNFLDENHDFSDYRGHGTFVSGIIAAKSNNGIGIAGINPGAVIMPLKVADEEGETNSWNIYRAVNYAVTNGARVINISLGARGISKLEQAAINRAHAMGVFVAVASGNNGEEISGHGPASSKHAFAVGETDFDGSRSTVSNWGPNNALLAPGEQIYSLCSKNNKHVKPSIREVGYYPQDGTSFSSPMVAATASLLLAKDPNLTPTQIRDILMGTTDEMYEEGWDALSGAGFLNAARALRSQPGQFLNTFFTNIRINKDRRDKNESVDIYGTVRGPFKQYVVEAGKGKNPRGFEQVAGPFTKPLDYNFITRIDVKEHLRGSRDWVLRIKVTDQNGKERFATTPLDLR